jgi:nucleotide-binding universal stress UspA family protein
MNAREPKLVVRRILVALDASTHSLAALDAAVVLAARLDAELIGLFVEDINLLRLAGLPFAREVGYPAATERPIDHATMERQLRVLAKEAGRAMAEAAARRRVLWSFRRVRGHVAAEVLAAAQGVDLLALGTSSRAISRRVRIGSTARAVVEKAPCMVLFRQHRIGIEHAVRVAYDGSAGARHAVAVAAGLAAAMGVPLAVFLLGEDAATAGQLEPEVQAEVRALPIQVRSQPLAPATVWHLAQAVRITGGGLLVLDGASPLLHGEGLQILLEAIDGSVLLVK